MSDYIVKRTNTEAAARLYCRFLNLELITRAPAEKRPRNVGGGRFAPQPEQLCGFRAHPDNPNRIVANRRWFVGPILKTIAAIYHGAERTLASGQVVTADFVTDVFDLDVVEAAYHDAIEENETRD